MGDMVCLECGADVGESRTRGWVHTSAVPRTAKQHDAVPVHRIDYDRVKHVEAVMVPLNQAREWAQKMRDQMLREEMKGVVWSADARHAVVLLAALEEAEAELLEQRKAEREMSGE